MHKTFIVSDTHFCGFDNETGATEIIRQWNSKVLAKDTVIHLGDVATRKKTLQILHKLNGNKILILGNHDNEDIAVYREYFTEVHTYYRTSNILFSHAPVVWPMLGTPTNILPILQRYSTHLFNNISIDTWRHIDYNRITHIRTAGVTLNIHGHFHVYGRSVFEQRRSPYTQYEEPHLYSRWRHFTVYKEPVDLAHIVQYHTK